MIKANELRRESLVLKDNRILPVYSIHGDNTFTLKKDGEIIGCFTEWQADPIPLTAEILEKAGFEPLDYGSRDTSYYIPERDNDFFLRYYVLEDVVRHEGKEIKYLHQLQNLYFALTGEELKIDV